MRLEVYPKKMVVLAPLCGSVQALLPDVRVMAFSGGGKRQGSYHVIDDPHRISDGAGLEAHAGHARDQFSDSYVAVAKRVKLDPPDLRGSLRDCIGWCEDGAYSGIRFLIDCFVILITTLRHEICQPVIFCSVDGRTMSVLHTE